MYEIAICDDDRAFSAEFRALLTDELRERRAEGQFTTFDHPDALLEAIEGGQHFDLIFQDVLFDGERGIRFTRLLRERKWNIDVIFISSCPDFAIEGYDAFPLHYLLKPVDHARLGAALDRFLDRHKPQILRFTTSRGMLQIQLSDVLYFEIYDHDIVIHRASGGCETCTGTLKEVEATLPPRCFTRPHRSYLVNLEHVSEIVRYRMRLSSGDTVPISKGMYPLVQRSLIEFDERRSTSL